MQREPLFSLPKVLGMSDDVVKNEIEWHSWRLKDKARKV